MKPAFLTAPAAWTRARRDDTSAVDAACAVEVYRAPRMDPHKIIGAVSAVGMFVVLAVMFAERFGWL